MLALALVGLLCLRLMTVLHESGHALMALLLFRGPVIVHLGSYGAPTGNLTLRLGRLRIYFKYNLLKWRGGYCQYQHPVGSPAWRRTLLILAGPLLPLLLAVAGLYLSFEHVSNLLIFLTIYFLLVTILGLINLIPSRQPIVLVDGRQIHNDGTQLRQGSRQQHLTRQAARATTSFAAGEYAESAALFEELLAQSVSTAELFRHAIQARLLAEHYAQGLALSTRYEQKFAESFTDADHFTRALLLSRLGQHPEALAAYSALIEQPEPYAWAYNNRGYTYNLLGEYELAIADFDQVIAADWQPAYAYCNRGLARLRLGQEVAGLADLAHGLALDPTNAYGYRNLGIYHLDRGEHAAALGFFEQARQHDPATHLLADYLAQARRVAEAPGV